jgi:glycerophosphoryl diester phosphodiesterase
MNTQDAVRWAIGRGRQRFWPVLAFSLAFKLVQAALVTPIVAGALRLLLHQWGRASVGNFEIAAFLLSLPGVAAVVGIGAVTLAAVYFEHAGVMRLVADDRLPWWEALLASGRLFPRLIRLGGRQLGFYLILSVPFLLGIGGVYAWLWRGRDLNGLIVLRPPEFWWGVGLEAIIGAGYVVAAGRWFLRWILAVPVLLFEPGESAREALEVSTSRMHGQHRRVLVAISVWLLAQLLLSVVVFAALRPLSAAVLRFAGDSLTIALPVTAGLLMLHAIAGGLLSVLATIAFAELVLVLYRQTLGHELPESTSASPNFLAGRPRLGWIFVLAVVGLAFVTSLLSQRLLASITLSDRLEITAHRAGAKHAPENSLSALRQAIRDRADWAEIDVQLTRDDELVILHDIDLARIGGGNVRVDAATLAEIRALDIGTPFGSQFPAERVPTLDEMLSAAGDDIRLNVELKPHGSADEVELARRVVTAIQQADMVHQCRICSQSYVSLQEVRRLDPALPIGFIAGASIGDLSRLEVDFLMLKADQVTHGLVDRAGARRILIHAWTVNDVRLVAPLLDCGVANIITDDPAAIRGRWEAVAQLSALDRLLLRVRSTILGHGSLD